jgi:PAS domain-containing protein
MKETNHDLIATHEIIRVLETSLYFSRNIIDNQPDIIIITDQAGRIYRLNQHGMNFFNRSKTEILGKCIDDLAEGRVKRRFVDVLNKVPFENTNFSNEDMNDEVKIYWQIAWWTAISRSRCF